ncbi:MAG: exodeoxyribonuclease VII small subunit [Desulfococcaceae bacterium]
MAVKQSFEKALKQLEEIVHELESGDLPLEKAMSRFEDGMRLSRFCSQQLDETERKITLLTQDQDGKVTVRESDLSLRFQEQNLNTEAIPDNTSAQ